MGMKGKKWYINLTKGETPPLSKPIEVPLLLKLHYVSTCFEGQSSKPIAKVKNLAIIIRTLLNCYLLASQVLFMLVTNFCSIHPSQKNIPLTHLHSRHVYFTKYKKNSRHRRKLL
jgi:hypothetical protein